MDKIKWTPPEEGSYSVQIGETANLLWDGKKGEWVEAELVPKTHIGFIHKACWFVLGISILNMVLMWLR